MGLWPGMAPLGYLNQKLMDRKCQIAVDPDRAPIVRKIGDLVDPDEEQIHVVANNAADNFLKELIK
jgi:hypothetical protein